jgi:hypothetical protein
MASMRKVLSADFVAALQAFYKERMLHPNFKTFKIFQKFNTLFTKYSRCIPTLNIEYFTQQVSNCGDVSLK